MRECEILVIGSGAGGGPLALTLAREGFDVLVLEKGPWYSRDAYDHDEINAVRRDRFLPPYHQEPHSLLEAGSEHSVPTELGWTASCVGGGTVVMASYLYRFHEEDLRMRRRFGDFEELADWPYSYQELEPFYCEAEWAVGVSGQGGSHPFESPRSRPYPMPPLEAHPLAESLERACGKLGLHSFPTPQGINSRRYNNRLPCAYCPTCAGHGCRIGAKGSSQESLLARALETGRCEIRSGAMVRKITTSEEGLASGCLYLDEDGNEHRVRAKVVCVSCSAVESARLLLLSESKSFPDGLANGNGRVGKHLQFHSYSGGMAFLNANAVPRSVAENRNPFLGRSVMDHYFLPEGVTDLPKGGILRFGILPRSPLGTAQRLSEEVPGGLWGKPLMDRLQGLFNSERLLLDFEVFHDFIPNQETYVDLDPDHRDRWGLPIARIHLGQLEHHRIAGEWLVDRSKEVLEEMGAHEFAALAAGEVGGFLVHGTCRAGLSPHDSVLNGYCQSHEVPNLFVVDGSFMPTSGGAPPTLTILANSFRTAHYIAEKGRQGELFS